MSTSSASAATASSTCRPVIERLRPVLADPSVLKIGHNIKYDQGMLARYGLDVTPVDDTMLISYVLDGASHGHGMDELAQRHLDHDCIPYEAVCGKGAAQIGFAEVPVDKATAYAAEDAEVTLRLWQALKPRLLEERMVGVYETLDRPLAPIVAEMEGHGIKVDAHRLRQLSAEFTQRMAGFEAEAYKLAGRSFNLGSPKQLGEVLFDELNLGGAGRKTKTGAYATGVEVLEELALAGHELPRVILNWRQLQKLTRTYTDALVEQVDPDHRPRPHLLQPGRHLDRPPVLQRPQPAEHPDPHRGGPQDPRGLRARGRPRPGLGRLLADRAAHPGPHRRHRHAQGGVRQRHRHPSVTASQMFGVPVAEVGCDLRRSAKTINYGIVYGIGAFGLAQRLGIPQAQAKAYIDSYFEQYPGIRDYMDKAKAEAREKGYVPTLYGRRCFVPEINVKIPSRRAYAERAAINAPIQGTAADIMKRAMLRTWRDLKRELPEVRMLLQVHDELVFEVPEAQVADTQALVKRTMEGAAAMSVPLVVEVGTGRAGRRRTSGD